MPAAKAEVSIDFVRILLARDGDAWVRAASSSMSPLIRPGDELRLRPIEPGRARAGSIVAFRRDGVLIVHRLVGASPVGLVTQGDALPEPDGAIAPSEIVARVTAIRSPGGRVLDLDRGLWPSIGRALAAVARAGWSNPLAWKARRLPFHVAAVLGR